MSQRYQCVRSKTSEQYGSAESEGLYRSWSSAKREGRAAARPVTPRDVVPVTVHQGQVVRHRSPDVLAVPDDDPPHASLVRDRKPL